MKLITLSFLLLILIGCSDEVNDKNSTASLNLKEIRLDQIEIVENPNPLAEKITKVGEDLNIIERSDDGYYLDYNANKHIKEKI